MTMIREISWGNESEYYMRLVEGSLYTIHFNTPGIEFACITCKTCEASICKCNDLYWLENTLRSDVLVTGKSKEIMYEFFELMVEHLDELKDLSRDQTVRWTSLNMHCDFELVCEF